MKRKTNWKRRISTALIVSMLATSISIDAFATEPTKAETTADENGQEQSTEKAYSIEKSKVIEKESTTDSTTYDIGDGKKLTEFYGQDVRFEDADGSLVDYDASLTKVKEDTSENGASLESYAYENKAGDKKQYFPEQLTEETPILMEYGEYQIRLRPVTEEAATTSEAPVTETEAVTVAKEQVTDIYEEEQTVPTKAVYTFGKEQLCYQYTSTDIGVKEEIVLEKEPESNVFRSILEIPGLTIRKNALDEGFTIYDGDEKNAGASVYRTRSVDKYVSLESRYKNANNKKVDIFVSVHHNASRMVALKGAMVLYAGKHDKNESKLLAEKVNNRIKSTNLFYNRGIKKRTDLAVLNGTTMPAILTETGYMSHYNDLLTAINNRNRIANAIVSGIKDYF